jgi:hypothetical protein
VEIRSPPFTSVSFKPASTSKFATPVFLNQAFSRDFKLGMTQSWNVSVEQQISPSMVTRLAYVGSESYHQSDAIDQNAAPASVTATPRPYSNFTQILTDFSNATSNYNSLQASFDRHMSHGLQVQSNFTWSKNIDVASSSNISFGSPYQGSHWDWVKTGYFNQAAFTLNAPGTFGDSAKNLMTGPREFGVDAAMMKSWSLARGTNLQFRWEAFNATNHPSFASPALPYGAEVTWGGFGDIVQTGYIPARVMQGALKLTF